MLRRSATVSEKIIRGVVHAPPIIEHHFEFLEKGVRDQLVLAAAVKLQEPAASKFLYWLGQVEPDKLDGYESIVFDLKEFNTRVLIQLPLKNNKHLDLVIDYINRAPPSKLMKPWFSWLFR